MRTESWAGAAVLAGYLVSDLFLEAPVSSAAITGLALAEYLVILAVSRRSEAFLLAEGALLAVVDYAAMLLGTTGAGVMLLELAGAAALLGSSAAGRPLLASYARRIPLIPAGGGMMERVNLAFGLLLLAHGGVMAAMTLLGGVNTALAVASFLVLYSAVLMALRRMSRREAVANLPGLVPSDVGERLRAGGETLAELSRDGERIVTVRDLVVAGDRRPEEVLRPLEAALAAGGARTVRFESWPGEEIQLEISGYHKVDGVWQKVLPVRGGRSPR